MSNLYKTFKCNDLKEIQYFLKNEIVNQLSIKQDYSNICILKRQGFEDLYNKIHNHTAIKKFFIDINLYNNIIDYAVYCMPPGGSTGIHIDGNEDNFQDWRVLIPISGYKNTTTTFYSSDIPPTKVESLIDGKHKQNYYTYDPKDCKIIDQFSGEDIYSIDTTTIHSAENPSNDYRIHLWVLTV